MLKQIPKAINGIVNASKPLNLAEQSWLNWLRLDDERQQADYQTYREYFNGNHNVPLTTRQEEYLGMSGIEFRFNFLKLPIKVLDQRLTVVGFDGADGIGGEDGILSTWWAVNRMDGKQAGLHQSTAVDGDTYALVEWDVEKNVPIITHERAYDGSASDASGDGVKVTYSDSSRRNIAFASKRWREVDPASGTTWRRLNIYAPEAIYKFRSSTTATSWSPFIEEKDADLWPLPWVDPNSGHPLGVPVVHFRHNDNGSNWGLSELDDLIPIQQALNKAVIDLIEGADKTAHQLITLSGGKASTIKINPRQVLYHSSPDASWGNIPAGDIEKLIRLKNDFIATIAQISQTPLSYFQITGQVARAETQKTNDTGLVAKAQETAVSYGNSWEDVMYIALRLSNAFGGTNYDMSNSISALWDSFVKIDTLEDDLKRSEIVMNLTNAGATLEGATQAAGYSESLQNQLMMTDQVDGIEQ